MPTHPLRRAVAFTATAAAVCALALSSVTAASAAIVPAPITDSAPDAALALNPLGSFESGIFGESAAEIVQAYRDRLFVVNAQAGTVGVLDNSDPTNIAELFEIASTGTANSLAIRDDGLGVVAFEAETKTDAGHIVFFDANADNPADAFLGELTVGALPDMVTISKDGTYAVVANEGEPADDFSVDPEGTVSIITLPAAVAAPAASAVKTATFRAFEPGGGKTLDPRVRVFGPDVAAPGQDPATLATNRVSRNLEPEYITVDGGIAYVALQEANSVAVVDLAKADVTGILPLGYKDFGVEGFGLDASDRDPNGAPQVNIQTYPGVKGLYMPDGLQSYKATVGSTTSTYLVTANEGDAREWGDFIDEARVKDLGDDGLSPVCATGPLSEIEDIQEDDVLGRLKVVTDLGITAGADCYSELYAYGGRSFSIWNTAGQRVFDSGDQFERITADLASQGLVFNASNDNNNNSNDRSDDKGPEPENVTIGVVNGKTYAFIGLERVGGVMVYDITNPAESTYVTYVNNRDFTADVETSAAGDLGPEGITFISDLRSPTGTPLLAVGNEVSGTTTVYEIDDLRGDAQPDVQVLTINDFHGRIVTEPANGFAGAAALAGAVDTYRDRNPNTLFVSAGDNIGASAFESFIQNDDPTLDALAAASLDVSAVGNHEFDQGYDDIVDRVIPALGGGQYALGANVYDKGTKTPALDEYAIEETESGARVAFIGVVTPSTQTLVNPDGIAGIEFGDMKEAVDRVAADIALNEDADVIIVLAHDGSPTSNIADLQADTTSDFGRLVHGLPSGVDAVVSAHTHQTYAGEVNGTPVLQAHQYGSTLGTLDIDLDEQNEVVSITPGLVKLYESPVSMTAAYPNLEVNAGVVEAKASADVLGREEVGTITEDIVRATTPAGLEDRGAHSTLGNTVADVYLWATSENPAYGGEDAQIAFMNPGGLRADLRRTDETGSVSYRSVANVQPFGNTLVTLALTPAQIKAVLEEQWQPTQSRPKLALGVSQGFTFEYDPAAPKGSNIVSMQLNGAELSLTDATTQIRVVTNSFLAAGGDNFATFAQGAGTADSGQIDLAATVEFFDAHDGPVAPAPVNRAYLIGEEPPVEGGVTPPVDPGTPPTEPGTLPGTGPDATPPIPVNPGGTAPAAGVQTGGTWADVTLGDNGRVEQGGSLTVTVSDLEPGQQIAATLFSDPIVVTGIPAANAAGVTTFTVAIPADFDLGAHRLVITAAEGDPIQVGVTVVARGALAATGSELPWGLALGGGTLLIAGGLAFALRKRREAVS